MHTWRREQGFTLIELVVAMAIIAVLAGIAIVVYPKYVERARASDIVVKYDAARTRAGVALSQEPTAACAEIARRLGDDKLQDDYAELAYGFEALQGGYRPVLIVCARADRQGVLGVKVARAAHDILLKNGQVEKGAVLTDTLASFAVALTEPGKALCKIPLANPATACGDPASTPSTGPAQPQAGTATQGTQPPGSAKAQTPATPPSVRPIPRGLMAGTAPGAPWVSSSPPSFAVVPTTVTYPESEFVNMLSARSPDGKDAVTVTAIEVDPAKATAVRNPDGSWRLTFVNPYRQGAQTTMTVRVRNSAGENSSQVIVRGH